MSSCKKLDFNYRQFIGEGEITYLGKADSLLLKGGNHRAELSWLLIADPKVTSYKIYWDNRQDSLSGSLTKTENVDTVSLILENLEEKIYEFEVFLFDDEGNSSVGVSAIGQVYGERYASGLTNRVFRTPKVLPGNELEMEWTIAENTLLYSEIKYQNIHDETVIHVVPSEVVLDTLKDFPSGNDFEVRSIFRPDSLAFDVFYTEYVTFSTPKVEKWWDLGFVTTLQYGAQPNQLSVWISQDFNGVYDEESVEAANWINVTDEFTLATNTTQTASGWMDVGPLLVDDASFYIAFRYDFVPGAGAQRTWTIRGFEVKSQLTEEVIYNTQTANFNLVTKGLWEPGRLAISASHVITLRGNSANTESPVTAWAVSNKIE